MGLIGTKELLAKLSPPLDQALTAQLLDEFISLERRFIQGDWEPAELDGGQFCEILARIVYHQDSGILNPSKSLSDCASYIDNDNVPHSIAPRHDAIHLTRVLRTVYKFRSQRGGVHISPNYSPNHMDAKLIVENVRWALNETLRVFWTGDREAVAKAIREILQFDVPAIGVFEKIVLVQRTDLSTEEEVLVLLHYAGEAGFTRNELGQHVQRAAPNVTRAVQKLAAPDTRQIVMLATGKYRLTDLGSKRIREQLSSKLLLE
jgi:hypothetical protein